MSIQRYAFAMLLSLIACQNKTGPSLPPAEGNYAPPTPSLPSRFSCERAPPPAPARCARATRPRSAPRRPG